MIKRSSIENLKSRVSLVEVASRVTTLKKRGHSYVGLSPFVAEKTPSFYVEPEKNVYYCFSTNKGGDLISFVQQTEKLDFYEAIETLAERYNIPLEYEEGDDKANRPNRSLKKELLEIHLYAAEFFQKAFAANHPEADAVRAYWTNDRKFTLQVAQDFGVGYAPANSDKLIEKLLSKNFATESLAQCGLFFVPQNGNDPRRWRQRFRGRLMIPLRDAQGQVIGFTGRKLKATPQDDPAFEAKYVNSPETPIFKKGGMLFNFDRARLAVEKQGFFLMVEGQLDALRGATSGYPATVAFQGTAVTDVQLNMIKRYESRLKVFLDGDRAGQAAALRMLPMALEAELDLTFHKLPAGIDPDLFFLQNGEGGLKTLEALTPMAFAIQALWPGHDASAQAKATAIGKILEIIVKTPSAVAQEAMKEELARRTHTDSRAIQAEFEKVQAEVAGAEGRKNLPNSQQENDLPKAVNFNKNLTSAEFELYWLLVQQPNLAPRVATVVDHEWLDVNDKDGQILSAILAEAHEGSWDPPAAIERVAASDEDRSLLYGLIARPLPHSDTAKLANDAIKVIYTKHVQRELERLKKQLQVATEAEEQKKLLGKQQILLNSLKKIPSLHHG